MQNKTNFGDYHFKSLNWIRVSKQFRISNSHKINFWKFNGLYYMSSSIYNLKIHKMYYKPLSQQIQSLKLNT